MKTRSPRGWLIVDIDGTVYSKTATSGQAYLTAGTDAENERLASQMQCSIDHVRQVFADRVSQSVTRTSVVLGEFRQTAAWWDQVRLECYRPHDYLVPNPAVLAAFEAVCCAGYQVVFATNNPSGVGRGVLDACGLGPLLAKGVPVLGPDVLGVSKAHPLEFFRTVADRVGADPQRCISIGDRYEVDCQPAVELGMHPLWVQDEVDLLDALNLLVSAGAPSTLAQIARTRVPINANGITVVAITGQAGSGKTTLAPALVEYLHGSGTNAVVLSLDAYFILSSAARRRWIEDAVGDADLTAHRKNQINWWDFGALQRDLSTLRATGSLYRDGVYNRADGGELTGSVSLQLAEKRGVVLVEGVALAHGHLPTLFDGMIMVQAHRRTREHDLYLRDVKRRPDRNEARQRFELTEAFETEYFSQVMPHFYGSIVTRVGSWYFLS